MMKRLFLICSILFLTAEMLLSKEQYIFTQISHTDGFTSYVNCIYKEKNGDVLVGSPRGLFRFNGSTIKPLKDTLFVDNEVFNIDIDGKGNLWILTNNYLACRRTGEKQFSKVDIPDCDAQSFHSMCHDDNDAWFAGMGKIFRYNYATGKTSLFCTIPDQESYAFNSITSIRGNKLLCCSHNGTLIIDKISREFSASGFGPHKEASASIIDSQGNVWIAFYNKGIEVFNPLGEKIKSFNTSCSEINSNIILCMTERFGKIWAGTDGGGINIIDKETGKVSILSHVSGNPHSFPAHTIKSIFIDHYENIWAGSMRNGLIRISKSEIKTYGDVHLGLKSGLSNPTVLCLYQEHGSEYIWAGTDGGGINRFEPTGNKFTHYPGTFKNKIVSIASYSDTELALSVFSDQIWIFNKNTGKTRPLTINDNDLNYRIKYGGRNIHLINEPDNGILLIGSNIRRLNRASGECTPIINATPKDETEDIFTIGIQDNGTWFHDKHHIYFLKTGATELNLVGSLHETVINCGHFGSDGNIWLATEQGLYRFDTSDTDFAHIETDLFKNARSVVCDMNSRVWIGTAYNLYAYLPDTGTFTIFGYSDGAYPNEYLSRARLLSERGDVLLGGVEGLLEVNAEYSIDKSEEPIIRLNKIEIDDEPASPTSDGIYNIDRNSRKLAISVSTQDRDIFRERMYRFMLSDNKILTSNSPTLSLRQMPPPGKYDVSVSCSKRNGEWCTPYKILTINIPQPWFLSWWFLCLCALGVLLIAGGIIVTITIRKNHQMDLALQEQEHIMYEEKLRMLINISHELRTPLTLIMAPLKRLIGSTSPEAESYPTLNRIYRQSRRMGNLLNMVLELRKMEVGKSRLKIESIEYNAWIRSTIADIIEEEHLEGIEVITDFDSAVNTVECDRQKCDTILMNILINAIKHSSKGDTITIRTRLGEDNMVITSISDQGVGLKDIDMSRLFTTFYQSNSEEYGSGIGLSYSKILVELHGGNIFAENNIDKGATFWWTLPVKSPHDATSDLPTKAYLNELIGYNPLENASDTQSETFNTSGMKLMLVDDNRDLLEFLNEALNGQFAEIIMVSSGNKALQVLSSGKLPDIIVSDVNMPDGDGFYLCKELKANENYSNIPVILLTASGEEQSQIDSYRMGAESFMAKPFEVDTLMELLRNILRRKADIRKRYLEISGESATEYGSNEENFILKLNKIIAEHISNPELDQVLICKELGVSRALLYNKMKAITGAGAKEYITRIRLEKAKSLIENTNRTIAEISDMTGFASQSYFSTAFKAYTGMTPSQYKKHTQAES